MRRVSMLVCVLTQLLSVFAVADDTPVKTDTARYFKTLEGMPVPSNVLIAGKLKGYMQTKDGKPLAGAEIFFFNAATDPAPVPEKYWRYYDEISKLDDKGSFSVELPPGKYYIGAVQRSKPTTILAPPSDGDIFYYDTIKYEVFSGLESDLGVIIGAKPFSRGIYASGAGTTAIEGKVFDAAGEPVENAIVASYASDNLNGRPLFGSERSGKDGGYLLRVSGAGSYYLRVREVYGVGALDGENMLVHGGNTPKAVKVNKGEIVKGINITGDKFLRPVTQ